MPGNVRDPAFSFSLYSLSHSQIRARKESGREPCFLRKARFWATNGALSWEGKRAANSPSRRPRRHPGGQPIAPEKTSARESPCRQNCGCGRILRFADADLGGVSLLAGGCGNRHTSLTALVFSLS